MIVPNDRRLSQLTSQWTLIVRAHAGGVDGRDALAELLPLYCGAVYRYLLGVVRNDVVVEELCQEFAFRFIRGDFRNARPEKGRFRDYLKVSVLHLVAEYRRRATAEKLVPFDSRVMMHARDDTDPEAAFVAEWRQELVNRAWAELKAVGDGSNPSLYDVLKRKTDAPGLTSAALAEVFAVECNRPMTAANVRQMLHRGREKFAALLRAEVTASLSDTSPEAVDAELADLGLLVYCMPDEKA